MLRPFFPYYGGKWRSARKLYPAPTYDVLVEPFAGSAGYSLRYPERRVILCDRDPIIAAVWAYLLRVSSAEILALPDVPLDGTLDDIRLTEEQRWLVGFWLNRSASPRRAPGKWMRSGIRPGSSWGPRVRCTIASQLDAIRHWRVHCCSYDHVPYDDAASWFIDPPYKVLGKHYRFGSTGFDYSELAEWCRTRRGQVIVCEQGGADWLPFSTLTDVRSIIKSRRTVEASCVMETTACQCGHWPDEHCAAEADQCMVPGCSCAGYVS